MDRIQRPPNAPRLMFCVLGIIAMMAAASATTPSTMPATASGDEAGVPGIIVQAHRGAGNLGPENTLESFTLSWKIGAIPEADIRETKDGVIVAFHDDALGRVVKNPPAEAKDGIGGLTWSEVSQLDVGSSEGPEYAGQRIPRICDVFAAMHGRPERMIYLDVKKVRFEDLAALAKEFGLARQLILASTKYEELRRWKQLMPDSRTLHWMGGTQEKLASRLEELRAKNFADVTQLQIHVKVGDLAVADPFTPSSDFLRSVGRELHKHGILFQGLPLGSCAPEAYRRLMDLGVESFATDCPDVALRVMRERAGKVRG